MSTIKTTESRIGDRLRQLREHHDLTQSTAADRIGKSQQAWGRYETGRSAPSVKVLQSIVEEFDANPEWLLTGVGSLTRKSQVSDLRSDYDASETVQIPVYEDALGAGQGEVGRDNIVAYGTFFRQWLKGELGLQPSRAFIAPVRGRSMEDLLEDGDLVLCERLEEIRYEDIYACRLNGELKVKHVHKSNGTITLRSENDRYPDIEVTATDDFGVLGRVVRRVVR